MKKLHDGTEVSVDTPTKLIDGKRYLLSPQELVEREAEETAHAAEKPVRDWRDSVDAIRFNSDDVENIIDAMNPSDRARLDKVTKDKYNDKKALRTQKPAGAP